MPPIRQIRTVTLLATVVLLATLSAQARNAPGFTYPDVNPNSPTYGESLSLGDLYAERGLVLNFLASWCGYCIHELPELEKLRGEGPVPILGVAADEYDGPVALKKMIERLEVGFPVLLVPAQEIEAMGAAYRHRTLPATYLIDRRGTIRRIFEGAVPTPILRREIRSTLDPPLE